jgi:hypothetical protein
MSDDQIAALRENMASGYVASVDDVLSLLDRIAQAERERDAAEDSLRRRGYRKSCEIPACNCGDQWNHGGYADQRLGEIRAALDDSPIDLEGKTLLTGVKELSAMAGERDDAHTAQRAAETELAQQMARLGMRADDAERERDALRAALREYGWHARTCPQYPTYTEPERYPPCDCGYDAALAGEKA